LDQTLIVLAPREIERSRGEPNCFGKPARFRVSGGQRIEDRRIAPLGELSRALG
jgi:hypothetical protein